MDNLSQKYLTNKTHPAPHTGKMLATFYKKNKINKAAVARSINRRASTLSTYEKNCTIQTAVLWEICHTLQHNFFMDIAALLPKDFTTELITDTTKDTRITQLEQEITILKAEKEVLLQALKG